MRAKKLTKQVEISPCANRIGIHKCTIDSHKREGEEGRRLYDNTYLTKTEMDLITEWWVENKHKKW